MSKLDRFLQAQERDYPIAMCEILNGFKHTHWIWYIFPQLRGIGHSERAAFYGIHGIEEAKAYLKHPTLQLRLLAAMDAMLFHEGKAAAIVLGTVDSAKLRSCATLFHLARSEETIFKEVLQAFFEGQPCQLTLEAVDQFA